VRSYTTRLENPADARRQAQQGEPTTRKAGPLRLLCSLAFVGSLLAACSSSPSASASQKVCNDRQQLSNAVSTVIDDLQSGSFGKAKDDVPAVRDALNSLSQSAQELTSEESQALSPQIDNLKKTVANLKNSSSLSDLQSGFNSLKSQLQSISNQISQTLKCS
jgi:cytochrome c556